MADGDENNEEEQLLISQQQSCLDPNYQDILDHCDSLRRSNLQLREEIVRLERENAELKKQTVLKQESSSAADAKLSEKSGMWPMSSGYGRVFL